ncbi:hypothetical protein [Bifidobacterium sp. ESL0704]|uniref:hypothetical protein n=1 Tax=Bifidobacterium sp. ESL0704 TaxID=2983219 RepID=UPI0023F8B86C|nr:hypothetical protein [Bifidobacterium sp. ESL0704]WEV52971.1 hypothetical protein OZX64_00200 [Bifidobacterium sp. ESL0704]
MNNRFTIFNGTVEITLPESYHPWNEANGSDAPNGQKLVQILETLSADATDADRDKTSKSVTTSNDSRFMDDSGAYLFGITENRAWEPDKLNEHLDECFQAIARSLPLVANAQIATKKLTNADEQPIGMIRYTFATPHEDWFACTLLLPNDDREALLNCVCPTSHLPAGALEFNAIADSIRFIVQGDIGDGGVPITK